MPTHRANTAPPPPTRRLLITAGPTHEPIDAVRYIGNRSSGRMGIALADCAAAAGWTVTLLLGPTGLTPTDSHVTIRRFRTTAELERLLGEEFQGCDALVMAAAVADYRPVALQGFSEGKLRRSEEPLSIRLESTPDLLARISKTRRPDQLLVGFALEPTDRLIESAAAKLRGKCVDMIVANPLETMESDMIEATLLRADGTRIDSTGKVSKSVFALTLLTELARAMSANRLKTTQGCMQ